MKAVIILCVLVVVCVFFESISGLVIKQREVFECQKGVSYVENECNTCFCIAENDLVCTIKQCHEEEELRSLKKCATGTTWFNDCNQCWCVNVGTVCTNYQCQKE